MLNSYNYIKIKPYGKIFVLTFILILLFKTPLEPVALAIEPLNIEYYFQPACLICADYEKNLEFNQTIMKIQEKYQDSINIEWLCITKIENYNRFSEYKIYTTPVLVFNHKIILIKDEITIENVSNIIDTYQKGSEPTSYITISPTMMTPYLIIISGLFDSINPCAIALLIFFISYLVSIHYTKSQIYTIGSLYIISVFFTYLSIGLGILHTINIWSFKQIFALISVLFLMIMGLIQIRDSKSYDQPLLTFLMPGKFKNLVKRATWFFAIPLGILVGLGEFPCSGAIYIGILALLSSSINFYEGLKYLILYNFIFVLPLILILLFAHSLDKLVKIDSWRVINRRRIKFISGIFLIIMGLVMYYILIY